LSSAAQAAPPLDAYGRLPAVELMRLSPDGDRFAFVAQAGEQRKLLVATVEGKLLTQSQLGQTKVLGLDWAGDDHVLVTTSGTADLRATTSFKSELTAVVGIDVSTSKTITVFKHDEGILPLVVAGEFGVRTRGGRWQGYFGGISTGSSVGRDVGATGDWADLYAVDLATGEPSLVGRGGPDVQGWVVSPAGAVLALQRYDNRTSRWELVAGGSDRVLLARTSPTDMVALAGMGRTPDTVVVTDDTGDRSTVEEVSLKDGRSTPLFQDVDVDSLIHDPSTHLLVGALTVGEPRAVFFDPALQARYDKIRQAFHGRLLRLASYTSGLDKVIVETEGTGDSGSYWFVDFATMKAHQLGATRPDIKPEDVGPVSVVEYKAADGLAMDGILTLPPGRTPRNLPLVVMPHGGPIGIRDEPGFDPWAQAFASRGYAVFQPNYRGSSGRGPAFRQAGYGEWGRKMLSDMRDGVDVLAARGIVDPKRACIVGGSYGGYAALAGVTLQHGFYRCSVADAAPADLTSFFQWEERKHGEVSSLTRFWRAATGVDKQGAQVLTAISPITFVKTVDAPILLIHGKDDTVVPVEQSEEMEAALKRAGKPVEIVEINGGDHWELHEDARETTMADSVAFVLKLNPPD
jgi:dipeptidyl aminopeptidase/acylaminoacyl peptidase